MLIPFLLATFAAPTAEAVERLDAHGFTLTVEDGDALDLLTVYRPQAFVPWSVSGQGLFELAGTGLEEHQQFGDDVSSDELRGRQFSTNVGFTGAAHRRFALGVAVPYHWGTGGPGWGDLRLSLPIGIAAPEDDSGGTFAILPWIDLPTGDEYRFLGDRGNELGAVMAFGGTTPRFQISFNLGAHTAPAIEYVNLRGGPHAIAGMGMAFALGERDAIRAEALYRPSLYLHETWEDWKNESPGEAILSYRMRKENGLQYTVGMAFPFTEGAGASLRALAGVGYTFGKDRGPDSDGDGIADKRDQCVDEPENRNGYQDRDGCPDALAEAVLTVVNDDDRPVPEAVLTIRGADVTTDEEGQAKVDGLIPVEPQIGSANHPFYGVSEFTLADLEAETLNERTIRLVFIPGEVRVTARREDGQPINARVRFVGPEEVPMQYLGPDGTAAFELRPGKWRLLISAAEFGTERHDLTIEPGQSATADVLAQMTPARAMVDIKRKEVRILEQVHFDSGQDSIKAESMPLLTQVANLLLDNPFIEQVEVQGHTDSEGEEASNMDLSQRRVENVTRAIVSLGVESDRLVAQGYGESSPLADNKTATGRALNRRVQFVIIHQGKISKDEAPPEPPPPPAPKIDTEGL